MSDDLTSAERVVRDIAAGPQYVSGSPLCVLLREFDRLRLVEQAATALVDVWDDVALRVQDMGLDEMHALEGHLDVLATVVRGEAVVVQGETP